MQYLINIVSLVVLILAIFTTFFYGYFVTMSNRYKIHSRFFHLISEVEVIFFIWAIFLVVTLCFLQGKDLTFEYINDLKFIEPIFMFCIMIISSSNPITEFFNKLVVVFSRLMPINLASALLFTTLCVIPLIGSIITEPAAITLAALFLKRYFFYSISHKLRYAILAVLLVNISVGGTLTNFSSPPVLMIANVWNWDFKFMLVNFSYKAILTTMVNSLIVIVVFRKQLSVININLDKLSSDKIIPKFIMALNLLFIFLLVVFAHDLVIFLSVFVIFLGLHYCYPQYSSNLLIKPSLSVACFLCALIVIGGKQAWWLKSLISYVSDDASFFVALALSSFMDNAAITYLASTLKNISSVFKYNVVAGAVSAGGLTVIANAPNLIAINMLQNFFYNQRISHWKLFIFSLVPTAIAILFFKFS